MNISPFILLAFFVLTHCTQYGEVVFEKNVKIPNARWQQDSLLYISFDIEDTTNYHHIFINVKNTNNYPYSNLWLFTTLEAPDNTLLKDTFECILANNAGKWLGAKRGENYGNQIPFKPYVRFPQQGTYTLQLQQAMRETTKTVKHITYIGLLIEKAQIPQP